MQPLERLPEVMAAADIHVVPLKEGFSLERAVEDVLDLGSRPTVVASVDADRKCNGSSTQPAPDRRRAGRLEAFLLGVDR